MKKESKFKIKSIPQFILFVVVSLGIIVLITMALVVLTTNLVGLFNTQRAILHATSSNSVATQDAGTTVEANTTVAAITTVAEPQGKTEVATPTADPLESIKTRLKSGDTAGIKVVFLTFDDGPSGYTGEVLDILNTYDAKGTFFTTLHDSDQAKTFYRRIVNEGHTLGNHTSSHDYSLYSNPQAFYADVDALDQYQKQVTGQTETSHVFRFPGGSLNANKTCALGMVNQGWNYADWNVSSGDGCSDPPAKDIVAQNIIAGCRSNDVSVVLCHAELKPETRAALPTVIETLKAEGYTFLAMEKDFTYPRHLEVQ